VVTKNMPVNIIAEIGSNWEGDIDLGKLHIKKAKESGATHVKFQMWRAEDLYETSDPDWNEIKKSELNKDVAIELKKYADNLDIKWFCSVFYPESVEFLESINVEIYKIASWTAALKHKFALETIQKVGQTKKQTFISTGNGIERNIVEKEFEQKKLKYTYCIAKYPALDQDIDWNEILKYNFFSDHTLGITIPLTYVILKKSLGEKELFIEKHVKLGNSVGPDAPFSITFGELQNMTEQIKRIEKMNLPNLSID
jgi:sialic acid synthase SpsE